MEFQEISSSRRRDADENFLCSSYQVSFITDRIGTKSAVLIAHAHNIKVQGTKEFPLVESERQKKTYFSDQVASFTIDWLQPNFLCSQRMPVI